MSYINIIFWIDFLTNLVSFSGVILKKRKSEKNGGYLLNLFFMIIYLFYFVLTLLINFYSFSIFNISSATLFNYGFVNLDSYFLYKKRIFFILLFFITFFLNIHLFKNKSDFRITKRNSKYSLFLIYMIQIFPYLILLNIIFLNCYDDGLLSLPIYFVMTFQFLFFSIQIKYLTYLKLFFYAAKIIQLYLFFILIVVYYANTVQGKDFFLNLDVINLFGNLVVEDNFDETKFVLTLCLLFFLNFYYNLLKREKSNWERMEKINKTKSFKNLFRLSDKLIFIFAKRFLRFYEFFSDKICQLLLILWGLSRISLIKFTFLTLGLIGLCSSHELFVNSLSKIAFFIAVVYVIIQTSYNFSFVDVFLKSMGSENDKYLFLIGIYKYYNLFHGHLLKFNYTYQEIKLKRKNEMIWDLFVFSIFFIIYQSIQKNLNTTKTNQLTTNKTFAKLIKKKKIFLKYIYVFISNITKFILRNITKFLLLVIVVCCTIQFDFLHMTYLIYFLMHIIRFKLEKVEILHKSLLFIIGCELVFIYLFHIFNLEIDQRILTYIGLASTQDTLFELYKEHFLAFLSLIISSKINEIKSNFVEENKNIDNSFFEKISDKYIWMFVYFINSLLIAILPWNIFSFCFLIFLVINLVVKLIFNYNYNSFGILFLNLWAIIIATFLIVFYFFMIFEDVLKNLIAQQNYFKNEFLGNFEKKSFKQIYIILSCLLYIALKVLKRNIEKPKTLEISNNQEHFSYLQKKYNPQKFAYYLRFFMKSIKTIKNKCLHFGFCFLIFYLCLKLGNYYGFIFLVLLLISISISSTFYWKHYWIPFFVFTIIFIICNYFINMIKYEYINDNFYGLHRYFFKIDYQHQFLVFNLIVLAYCYEFKTFLEKEEKPIEKNFYSYLNQNFKVIVENEKNFEHFQNYIKDDVNLNEAKFSEEDLKLFEKNRTVYLDFIKQKPFIIINQIFYYLTKKVEFLIYPFTFFFILFLSCFEYNIFSLFYLVVAVIFSRFIFDRKKRKNLLILKYFFVFLIIFEIIMIIGIYMTNYLQIPKQILIWQDSLIESLCDVKGKNIFSDIDEFKFKSDFDYCERTWKKFLLFSKKKEIIFFLHFLVIVFSITILNFIKSRLKTEKKTLDKSLKDFFKFLNLKRNYFISKFYNTFTDLTLISFFICAIVKNFSGNHENILGILYAACSIIIFITRGLHKLKHRKKLLLLMETINYSILFLQIVYMTPSFKCAIFNKNRIFVSSDECFVLFNQNSLEFFKKKDSFDVYPFVMTIFGIWKLDSKKVFFFFSNNIYMLFFCFMALLLNIMWHNVEYEQIVISKRENKHRKRIINSIKFLLDFYLNKFWNYEKYKKTKEIFKRRNKMIDNRIKKWQKSMSKRSKLALFVDDEEKAPFCYVDNIKKQEIRYRAEKFVNDLNSEEPIIDIEKVQEILEQNYNNEEINNYILNEQKKKLFEIVNYLIEFRKLNLGFLNNHLKREFLQLNDANNNMDFQKLLEKQINILEKSRNFKQKENKKQKKKINEEKSLFTKFLDAIIFLKIMLKYILLLTLSKSEKYSTKSKTFLEEKSDLKKILSKMLKKYSVILVYFSFFINLLSNGNLISIFPVILFFLYGITTNPFSSKIFWNFLFIYMFIIIILKTIYQLPLFCTTYPFVFSFSDECRYSELDYFFLYSRIDYLIGIRKFYGESSFPKNGGIFFGLMWDYFILITLVLHRSILKKKGIWDFIDVSIEDTFYVKINKEKVDLVFENNRIFDNSIFINEIIDDKNLGNIGDNKQTNQFESHDENLKEGNINFQDDEDKLKITDFKKEEMENSFFNKNFEKILTDKLNIDNHSLLEKEDIESGKIKNEFDNKMKCSILEKPDSEKIKISQKKEFSEDYSDSLISKENISSENNSDSEDFKINLSESSDLENEYLLEKSEIKEKKKIMVDIKKDEESRNNFINILKKYLNIHTVPKYVKVENKDNPFETLIYEPLFLRRGIKLYKILFLNELVIFFFLIFFYDVLIGSSNSFHHALEKSQFSEDMVMVILKLMSVILLNRVCYCKRYTTIDHKIMKYSQDSNPDINTKEINENYNKESTFSKFNLLIRLALHWVIVIYIHYFIFKEVALKNKKLFFTIPIAQLVYCVFFFYMMISSYQIQHGFANDEHFHNPYKSEISVSENVQRKIFHAVPFLYEVKVVLDWTITETALDLFQWFKLEDAYTTLKLVKYQMKIRKEYPFPLNFKHKFFSGFCFLIFLLGIIILPILIFSTLNPTYIVNEPLSIKTNIKLWTYADDTIKNFELFSSQDVSIKDINEQEYNSNLSSLFKMENNDKLTQLKKLMINTFSEQNWIMSSPKEENLYLFLDSKDLNIFVTVSWYVEHEIKNERSFSFGSNTIILKKDQIEKLKYILKNPNSIETLDLENIFPKLIYMDSSKYLMFTDKHNHKIETIPFVYLSFKKQNGTGYWEMKGEDYKKPYFYIHCDFILGSILGETMKNMSVIGFYVTIVLAIGQVIKSLFQNIMMRVIYEEMSCTNQLIEFCDSIYMARKEKDLIKEKHLYELLVQIYRSPELLIQLTSSDNIGFN